MSLLLRIIADSFAVLGRNFVLLYPLLFFSLILEVLIPRTTELPSLELKWVALFSILFLLYYAFTAGWFKMIYEAVNSHLKPKTPAQTDPETMPDPFLEPFRLFKEFFPGVGEFFGPFALGGALQFSALLLLLGGAFYLVTEWIGIPPGVDKLFSLQTEEEVNTFFYSLPMKEQMQWGQTSLLLMGTALAYCIFYMVTVFWPSFVLIHRVGALKAYGLSILQFFKDPFRVLAIGLLNAAMIFTLVVLLGANAATADFFLPMMLAVQKTYFSIVLVMYVAQVNPGPATSTDPEGQPPALTT